MKIQVCSALRRLACALCLIALAAGCAGPIPAANPTTQAALSQPTSSLPMNSPPDSIPTPVPTSRLPIDRAAGISGSASPQATPTPQRSLQTSKDPQAWLEGMTLEQKVGQVMVTGFEGPDFDPGLADIIENYHTGGVILFARNITSPGQVAGLTNAVQQAAERSGSPGMIVAIDQEGGRVARLTESQGFSEFPGAMALAATGDAENARRAAEAIAAELQALGINTDFAPVLDVNNNAENPVIGIRSFGSDPHAAASYGVAFLEGLQGAGILAAGKHFPGHGDTSVDSHLALPVIPHARERLEAVEFVPFRAAIAAGVAGIMSAHVTFPAIDVDSGRPATLSAAVLTGLLREELGYSGLLVTDSLEMGALAESGFPAAEAAALALAAGADVLLFNRDHSLHQAAYHLILERVRSGEIPESRLDEAAGRVLAAKARFGLLQPTFVDEQAAASRVGTPERRQLARDLALAGVTLLRNEGDLLPLQSGPEDRRPLLVVEGPEARGLGKALDATHVAIQSEPTRSEIEAVLSAARDGRTVLFASADAARSAGQVSLVDELLRRETPVIVVALRSPYDLLAFPEVPAYLATYGSNPPAIDALLAVLKGEAAPAGVLPVEIPGLYETGAGLKGY